MSRVIIATKQVDRYDLTDLRRFGDVVRLDVDGTFPDSCDETTSQLFSKIIDIDPREGDYVALVGDPVHMALVAAAYASRGLNFRLLRYDKRFGAYYPVSVVL